MVNDGAVKIHVFVAVLAFSRRIFAKAYPAKINPHGLMALNRHFSSSRRVQERSSATTPDVWFAPTNAAAQSNGRKPLRAFVSTGPSNLLLVRHIIRSQRERWKERCAMYKAMPCKANRSKVCRRSIIGWSTGP